MPHSLDLTGRPVTVIVVDDVHLQGAGATAPVNRGSRSGLRPGMAPYRRRIFNSAVAENQHDGEQGREILADHAPKSSSSAGEGALAFLVVVIIIVLFISGIMAWFDWLRSPYVTVERTRIYVGGETIIRTTPPSNDCAPVLDRTENGVSFFTFPRTC